MLWHVFYNAFGLDMSDLSIKIVQLKNTSFASRTPTFSVKNYRSVDLPPGLIVNGELQKPEEIRKFVQQLLVPKGKERAIKGYWVVASIPETQSFTKLIQTELPANTLTEADVFSIAKQHIPFEEEEYYLDWQVIPQEKTGATPMTSILIGASPKKIADSYTYLLESLGFGVIALEIEAIAIARSMITANKQYGEEARMILDMGAIGTSIIVYDNECIQFSTTIPFSGELLTTAIAQKLNIPHDEAEAKKKKEGLEYQKGAFWPIIASLVDTCAVDIKKTIDFYYAHFPDAHRITHITLCGGMASMKGIDDILSASLSIEVTPGNPWKNVSQKNTPDIKKGWEYATAIGLALRAADNPFLTHDSI